MEQDDINAVYRAHYEDKFSLHGPRLEGVDWGADPADLTLRLERICSVLERGCQSGSAPSILEVGCGYGSLLDHLKERGIAAKFTGLDLCEPMIVAAKERHPDADWQVADIFDWEAAGDFDFVVCNGLVNLKLEASLQDIKKMSRRLLRRMFELSRVGCALNFMTSNVNYCAPHLYYQNPVEILAWSMTELTTKVCLDHAYSLYEFTLQLYREEAPGMAFGGHRKENPSS